MSRRIIIAFILLISLSSLYIACSETPLAPNETQLVVSDFQQVFSAPFGGPSPGQLFFHLSSSTDQVINYKISHSATWLQVVNSNQTTFGLTPDSVLFLIRVATPNMLPYGTYYDTVIITTDSVKQEPIEKEIILHIGSQIAATPNTFIYNVNVRGTNPTPQRLRISSTTIIDFDVSLTNSESWLQLPVTSQNTDDTTSIPLNILSSTLVAGTYRDTIWISSDSALNSPFGVPVELSVKPWLKQNSPRNNNIDKVFFTDSLHGWAVGDIVDNF